MKYRTETNSISESVEDYSQPAHGVSWVENEEEGGGVEDDDTDEKRNAKRLISLDNSKIQLH